MSVWRLWALGWVLAAGCLEPAAELCGGLLCPPGKTCAPGLPTCIFPDQLVACAADPAAAVCHFGNVTGYCHEGVCLAPSCGNAVVEAGELCDDGINDGTACSRDCRSDLRCGNSVLDRGETCDCGDGSVPKPSGCNGPNADDADATCSLACTLHVCGDGLVSSVEECEPSLPTTRDTKTCVDVGFYETKFLPCKNDCRYDRTVCVEHCGDNVVNGGEVCDGAAPPGQTCLDYNYDAGILTCDQRFCGADRRACLKIGWVRSPLPVSGATNIHYVDSDDVYVLANRDVYQFDTTWHQLPAPPAAQYALLWASGPTDVYVGGYTTVNSMFVGVVYRYDGTTWTQVLSATGTSVTALWGAGPSNVFIGSSNGGMWHYAGSSAVTLSSPTTTGISDIRGQQATDVYAVAGKQLLHYDGTGWTNLSTSPMTLYQIGGFLSSRIVFLGVNAWAAYDTSGTPTWYTSSADLPLYSVWANRTDNIFGVGLNGLIDHFDGGGWTQTHLPLNPLVLKVVGSRTGRDLWALTSDAVWRYAGASWQIDSLVAAPVISAEIGAVLAEGLAIAQSLDGKLVIYERNGNDWTQTVSSAITRVQAAWLEPSSGVYVATASGVVRWDKTSFTSMYSSSLGCRSVWASSGSDVYAVCGSDTQHSTGSTFTPTGPSGMVLGGAVWGTSTSDVFVVGPGGLISHFNGTAWSSMPSGTTANLFAIWGSGPNDVFAVGNNATVVHYDGSTWTKMTVPASATLSAVGGSGPTDVFVLSGDGVLLHYDSNRVWTQMRADQAIATSPSVSLAVTPKHVFFAGTNGRIVRLERTEFPWP